MLSCGVGVGVMGLEDGPGMTVGEQGPSVPGRHAGGGWE